MDLFQYIENNGRVLFGIGSLESLPNEITHIGCKAPLLLTTSQQASLVDNLTKLLKGQVAGSFTGATMHTPIDITKQALDYCNSVGADCLVSIGGGSTTGLGKALSIRTGLPHITIPTTYAGSEMTPILGETENNRKVTRTAREIIPNTVIYDPTLTMTLPPSLKATSGLNAMAHAIEAVYARDANPIVNIFALEGIRSLSTSLPQILRDPNAESAHAQALFGAWLCGKCLATTTVSLHHKLCHVLGGSFGLPHAETHSIILPHAVAYTAPSIPRIMQRLAKSIPNSEGDAVRGLNKLVSELNISLSLHEIGLKEEDIETATDVIMRTPFWNPRPLERGPIRELIRRAWNGEPACVDSVDNIQRIWDGAIVMAD